MAKKAAGKKGKVTPLQRQRAATARGMQGDIRAMNAKGGRGAPGVSAGGGGSGGG